MGDHITYVGLDVHKQAIVAAVAEDGLRGEVREYGRIANTLAALDRLARKLSGEGVKLRSFPFGEDVEKFLEAHKLVFVIEQNRDAQMRSLLTLETRVEKAQLRSLLHYSGLPISSEFIVKGVLAEVEPKTRKPEVVAGGVA